MHACLTVTCHLHFWQNDWDFYTCATAITQGWKGHRNESAQKADPEKKKRKKKKLSPATPAEIRTRDLPHACVVFGHRTLSSDLSELGEREREREGGQGGREGERD